MFKFKVKNDKSGLSITVEDSKREVDQNELALAAQANITNLMRPVLCGRTMVKYNGFDGVTLKDFLKGEISESVLYTIVAQISALYKNIDEKKLSSRRLVTELERIYINPQTMILEFIYYPSTGQGFGISYFTLVENIVESIRPDAHGDKSFAMNYLVYMRSEERAALDRIDRYIAQKNASASRLLSRVKKNASGYITDKPADYYNHYGAGTTGSVKEASEPLPTKSPAPPKEYSFPPHIEGGAIAPPPKKADPEETTSLLFIEEDTVTQLGENSSLPDYSIKAYLTRFSTNERIPISKPVFRIGKEKSYVDYFVANNETISRSHADIINRAGKFYIYDHNSMNKTFINDIIVKPKTEVEIVNGVIIRLSNEEFKFEVSR